MPKITFGMIVLNGEPFITYNLRSLYPFAHEIIVVEGAAPASNRIASVDGHSTDGTLDAIKSFQQNEDPEEKVHLITAEDEGYPNGFWPGEKDEQSQAYAIRAKGDYLWQVDVDEFYHPWAMETVSRMLDADPSISAISFKMLTFWGALDYITDGWYLRRGANEYHRLFQWGSDYKYSTHRPPTVLDPSGNDLRGRNWIRGRDLTKKGIVLHHYSLLLPKQVLEKCEYYSQAEWAEREGALRWAQHSYLDLEDHYRVHNVYTYPSWLDRFHGMHPPEIERMWEDIQHGQIQIELRKTEDIEYLLTSKRYQVNRALLRLLDYPNRLLYLVQRVHRKVMSLIAGPHS